MEPKPLLPTWIDCYYTVKVGDTIAIRLRETTEQRTIAVPKKPVWAVCLDNLPGESRILLRVVKVCRQSAGHLAAKVIPIESSVTDQSDQSWECPRGDCTTINPPDSEYCSGEKCVAFRKWADANQEDAPEDR